jgi:phosphate:Na+ symporter
VRALLTAITGMPILNVIFGAVLAWAAHSSVAVVLLVISLAYSSFITPVVAFALVLGANLGSAVNPLLEGGCLGNPIARRLPLGNLINRAFGCALVLPFLQPAVEFLSAFDTNPVRLIADFHTLFNLALAAIFIIPLPAFAKLLQWILPPPAAPLILGRRYISMSQRTGRRRWRSQVRRGKRCIWAILSRRCCGTPWSP